MGRYCSYLLPKQGGVTSQIQVNKTLSTRTWDALYLFDRITITQAADRKFGTDEQQGPRHPHTDQELRRRRLRENCHGDSGRVGLVPRPAGDDADAQIRVGNGLDEGDICLILLLESSTFA